MAPGPAIHRASSCGPRGWLRSWASSCRSLPRFPAQPKPPRRAAAGPTRPDPPGAELYPGPRRSALGPRACLSIPGCRKEVLFHCGAAFRCHTHVNPALYRSVKGQQLAQLLPVLGESVEQVFRAKVVRVGQTVCERVLYAKPFHCPLCSQSEAAKLCSADSSNHSKGTGSRVYSRGVYPFSANSFLKFLRASYCSAFTAFGVRESNSPTSALVISRPYLSKMTWA